LVIAGGAAGTLLGTRTNAYLAGRKRALAGVFAGVVIATGLYIVGTGILKVLTVS
jgi:hypothetical protein